MLKAYVVTTGAIFVLVFAAHIWRAAVEGPELRSSPVFMLLAAAAAALAIWSWRAFRSLRRP